MSAIKNISKAIFGGGKKEVRLVSPIDEELIERDDVVKALQKKLQSQSAQLSKISAKKQLGKEQNKEKSKATEKISELQRQYEEKNDKFFQGATSFNDIIKFLESKKGKGKIDLTDKDDKVVFGKLGKFVILPNAMFGVTDAQGQIMSYGYSLRQIIHKPEGLGNQIKRRKRLALPCNEDFVFMPDIEEYKLPECTYNEKTGKIKWAQVREKPLKNLIIEREELIREKDQYIEKIEQDKVDLVRNLRDIQRSLRVQKNISENSQTELSIAMDKSIQFEQKIGGLQMRVIKQQEMENINNRLISGLKEINKELLSKAEEMGSKTEFRKALDMVQVLMSQSFDNVSKVESTQVKEKKEVAEAVKK